MLQEQWDHAPGQMLQEEMQRVRRVSRNNDDIDASAYAQSHGQPDAQTDAQKHPDSAFMQYVCQRAYLGHSGGPTRNVWQ